MGNSQAPYYVLWIFLEYSCNKSFDFPSTFVLVDCSAIDLLNPQNHQNVHVSLPSMAEYCPKNKGELLTGRKVVVSVLQ